MERRQQRRVFRQAWTAVDSWTLQDQWALCEQILWRGLDQGKTLTEGGEKVRSKPSKHSLGLARGHNFGLRAFVSSMERTLVIDILAKANQNFVFDSAPRALLQKGAGQRGGAV